MQISTSMSDELLIFFLLLKETEAKKGFNKILCI